MNRWIALGVLGFCAGGCVAGGVGVQLIQADHAVISSEASPNDRFGEAVATDGVIALVGATQPFSSEARNGAVYVFDIATGTEIGKLVAPDGAAGDKFGLSVAFDGDIAVIGAPEDDDLGNRSGSAYIMRISDGSLIAKINGSTTNSSDEFGSAVAIEGDRVVVGAPRAGFGSTFLFDASGNEITQLVPPGDTSNFGRSVAIDGGRIIVANLRDSESDTPTSNGSAQLYDAATGAFLEKLVASNGQNPQNLGWSVAICGDVAVAGATRTDGTAEDEGSALVFDLATAAAPIELTLAGQAPQEDDRFGWTVAASESFVVGGAPSITSFFPGPGRAYVYDAGSGSMLYRLFPSGLQSGAHFGLAMSMAGSTVVVGAPADNTTGGSNSGTVFFFTIPEPPCPADLAEPTGILNFFDLGEFLTLFNAQDPSVDFAEPFGTFNFFDLGEFLTLFNQGCP